ncbi:MAG: NAD(P)H-dependent glycerol-3-phosphate dehydrogenase [bacterium]
MNICVMGGGTWGITLACLLFDTGNSVKIWEFSKDKVDLLKRERKEPHLPWLFIPSGIEITDNLEFSIWSCDLIVVAIPSWTIREAFLRLKEGWEDKLIISCSKGLEEQTFLTPSQVIRDVIKDARVVALSGPSHAEEVSKKIPTAIISATPIENDRIFVQNLFSNQYLRVYTNPDIIGVELGGALKNIIAIASGISDGLGFGDNTKAGLFCRGMAEMVRFGISFGGNKETFFGLSGMGDLMVTCISRHSRNRRFGELLGKGESPESAEKKVNMAVEGIRTTKAVYEKSKILNIDMPITDEVYKIIFEKKKASEAVLSLLKRELKEEVIR